MNLTELISIFGMIIITVYMFLLKLRLYDVCLQRDIIAIFSNVLERETLFFSLLLLIFLCLILHPTFVINLKELF